MSTKMMPPIPPRPTRAQDKHDLMTTGSTLGSEIPKIPPRPIHRRIDRSQSPHRDSYAPSPLNELSYAANQPAQAKTSLYSSGSANASSSDLPRRPSSVTLPSIGQEGNEYAEVFGVPDDLANSPTQTRSVANDLQLHAPKPSLPVSSAKQRVSTVTRTDSNQAAALGIGKASSDDAEPHTRSLKAKASFASQTSNSTERPPSTSDGEHGIPEIGQRVPMYPNAGDVQAPSPAPFATPYAPGIGFHNDGSKPRHHGRRTSGRGFEMPPGSYGLHGHGIVPNDRFEKLYYEKHPELLKKECGQYGGALGDGRGEWALSSDDLNKIVRETASRGAGLGTSPAVMSTPTEDVGFLASEEYTSRMSSPHPQSVEQHHRPPSLHSQTHVDSPLRRESFPTDAKATSDLPEAEIPSSGVENVHESEVEEDDIVHIDPPERRASALYGLPGHMESTESLGRHDGTPGEGDEFFNEHGYSAPILAADEVAKNPFGYELQPAVSPMHERSVTEPPQYRTGSASSSRPSSRPVSIHGGIAGIRFQSEFERDSHHTPLEDLDEYEPLFPDDEKKGVSSTQGKHLKVADALNRPDLKNRKFPSQDIWEDTPNSLHYTATVSSPQLPEEKEENTVMKNLHVREGETPEQAFARRQEELAEAEAADADSFLNREKKPWSHNADLDARPNMKQRFPSRDIWESTPDSLQLTTTVSHPQLEEKDIMSPPEDRPTTGAVAYHQEKAAAGIDLGEEEGRATTGIASTLKPQVPARPTKQKTAGVSSTSATSSPTDKTAPPVPVKSKPQVPARPAKSISKDSETAPLSKVTSASSSKSVESDQGSQAASITKAKPPVPSRPVGSKIAALHDGFLSDLNKRLQLGPQAPKKEEPVSEAVEEETEKAPLSDARKGRARGPVRKAPAMTPAPGPELSTTTASAMAAATTLGLSKPTTLWHIDPKDDMLSTNLGGSKVSDISESKTATLPELKNTPVSETKAPELSAPILATNTAGESLQDATESGPNTEQASAPLFSSIGDLHAQKTDNQLRDVVATADDQSSTPSKPGDQPPVISTSSEGDAAPGDLSGSTGTIKPSAYSEEEQLHQLESDEPPITGIKENLETVLGGKEAITEGDGHNIVETGQVPGSFEQ